jgi:bacteriocin biosynthesis cyclodehydratase domain-containing protein
VPRLKPSVEPFLASTGDLYLIRTDGGGDVVLRDSTPFVRTLVDALRDGRRELAGLAPEPQLATALSELEQADLLAESPQPERLGAERAERYDRQLHYFADQATERHTAEDMQQALASATVVVIGVGGLGSWTISGLACAGVGRVVAVDDDRVELSNLNRQILYRTADLGQLKVDVAGRALRAFNPDVEYVGVPSRVASVADALALVGGSDFVVCTADAPIHLIGRWVNEACHEAGVPHISAGQFPPRIRIGPTFVPGSTGCLGCQELAIRDAFPHYDELVEQRRRQAPVAATLGAASGVIGSLIAMEAVHSLTGITTPATLGRGLVFDLRDFSTEWEEVVADPRCPLGCAAMVD